MKKQVQKKQQGERRGRAKPSLKYRVIDCDGHLMERAEEFGKYMDPTIRSVAERNRPFAIGCDIFPSLDGVHYLPRDKYDPVGVATGSHPVGSPEDWVDMLDATGIEQTVLFASEALSVGLLRQKEYTVRVCRAYNDWAADRYTGLDKRLRPMAVIPMQFPDEAAKEMKRAVTKLGMPGAMLPATGLQMHLGHEYYWPVYRTAADLDCALTVHGGANQGIGLDSFTDLKPSRFLHHPVSLMRAFVSLAYDGVFDAFPKLRIGFLEGGAGWVVFILDRAKRENEFFPGPNLQKYLQSGRILIGCEGIDMTVPYLIEMIGDKALAWSSDYPHEPGAEAVKHEMMETIGNKKLTPAQRTALLSDNAQRFFKLSDLS